MRGIYKIYCTTNGKSYVGSALNIPKRWSVHKINLQNRKHTNRHLQNAWLKHGSESFEWSVLEIVEQPEDLISREQHWIDLTERKFNIRKFADSNLGVKLSAESRAKIGAASKGRVKSPEARAKLSAALKGRVKSPEARAKMSAAGKGRVVSPETRAKISAANKANKSGRIYGCTPEARAKISDAAKIRAARKRAAIADCSLLLDFGE